MKRFLISLGLLLPVAAFAHPMGNVSINKYARVTPAAGVLRLHYVLDLAELPTLTERRDMDTNGDGEDSDAETQAYLADRVPNWLANCKALVDGKPVTWEPVSKRLDFIPGEAGLMTMRIEMDATAPLPDGADDLKFADLNYKDRIGWKQVFIDPMPGTPGASAASTRPAAADVTDALRRYPAAMVAAPPQVTTAEARVHVPPAPKRAALNHAAKAAPKPAAQSVSPPALQTAASGAVEAPPAPVKSPMGKPAAPPLIPARPAPAIHPVPRPAPASQAAASPSGQLPEHARSDEAPSVPRPAPLRYAILALAVLALGISAVVLFFQRGNRPRPTV